MKGRGCSGIIASAFRPCQTPCGGQSPIFLVVELELELGRMDSEFEFDDEEDSYGDLKGACRP
jgi:hypothetical protein